MSLLFQIKSDEFTKSIMKEQVTSNSISLELMDIKVLCSGSRSGSVGSAKFWLPGSVSAKNADPRIRNQGLKYQPNCNYKCFPDTLKTQI